MLNRLLPLAALVFRAQNTASGSQTIQFDTGAMWGSAALIIQDIATN